MNFDRGTNNVPAQLVEKIYFRAISLEAIVFVIHCT